MRRLRSPHFFLTALTACYSPLLAAAARLAVDPITLTLPAAKLATTLNLSNKGSRPATLQAEVFLWQQLDGKDVLTPTQEVLVSPPLFQIPVGRAQSVRIGRLAPQTAAAVEQTYRLVLTEIAPEQNSPLNGIATVLKLSLPVLVPAAQRDAPSLQWQLKSQGGGLVFTVQNPGNSSVKIAKLGLEQAGKTLTTRNSHYYILHHQTRSITWEQIPAGFNAKQAVVVVAHLGGRKVLRQELLLDPPTIPSTP